MKKRISWLAVAMLLIGFIPLGHAAGKLKVVASFSVLGDVVHQVGGNAIDLYTLVGNDSDVHVYSPRPSDIRRVAQADLLIMSGLGLEGWMARLQQSSGFKGKMVIASQGIQPLALADEQGDIEIHEHEHHGKYDPHVWHDVDNVIIYVHNIERALSEQDPAHQTLYAANARAYIQKLTQLKQFIQSTFNAIPHTQRKIITSHDAFGYLAHAYHLQFIAPQGTNTAAEASAYDVASIIKQIKAEKITAVFIENISDPRLITQISRETHAKIGGELYSDALSKNAPTYIEMMRHNVTTIAKALTASAQ
ncbi:metal ABC transporter substrate-binding protein [Celerinatantimonas sp. YJH-8]|uniref:metal ABC transporter substrate-binding protein n=1 Tax=Celerinatantimonas sp. YJH-8 TaxID=3228714 RepID=UPI0038C57CF2